MAVHTDRVLVDRTGQGGERLQIGQGGLPVALVVLAETEQFAGRGGARDGVHHRLQDAGGVPVPLPLVGTDARGHPLADPLPEVVPVRAGRGGQLVGDVGGQLGRWLDRPVGRGPDGVGPTLGPRRPSPLIGTHPAFRHELVGTGPRPASSLRGVAVGTVALATVPDGTGPPSGHTPPSLADHRGTRGPVPLRLAVAAPGTRPAGPRRRSTRPAISPGAGSTATGPPRSARGSVPAPLMVRAGVASTGATPSRAPGPWRSTPAGSLATRAPLRPASFAAPAGTPTAAPGGRSPGG